MRRQRGVHSVKLLLVCILASTTFAFGFLAAVRPDTLAPPSPPPRVSPPQHQQAALSSVVPSAPADSGEVPATVGVDAGSLAAGGAPETSDGGGLRTATFTKILPFPFEQVLDYWENGPPDPNFIREDIVLQVNGAEEHRSKTIYTKNPLPWILRKTLIREDVFVFREEQRINMRDKYSHASCYNLCLHRIGILTREARMSAMGDKGSWTKFEQTITTNFTTAFGHGVKDTMEGFAVGLFIQTAKRGTGILERTLKGLSAREEDASRAAASPPSASSHSAPAAVQERDSRCLPLYTGGVYAWSMSSALLIKAWTVDVLWAAAQKISALVSPACPRPDEPSDAIDQAGREERLAAAGKRLALVGKLAQPLLLTVLGNLLLSLHRRPAELTLPRHEPSWSAPLPGSAEQYREEAEVAAADTLAVNTLRGNGQVRDTLKVRGAGASSKQLPLGALVWPGHAAEQIREMAASAAAAAFVG